MGLISEKANVLRDFGLTDKDAVKAYLKKETKGITNPYRLQTKLDNLARAMIDQYFNGSREFVVDFNNGKERD